MEKDMKRESSETSRPEPKKAKLDGMDTDAVAEETDEDEYFQWAGATLGEKTGEELMRR